MIPEVSRAATLALWAVLASCGDGDTSTGAPPATPMHLVTLYVGNLPYDVTENDLREAFRAYGEVTSVDIVKDRVGRFRGFAFVMMSDKSQAQSAIRALNQRELKGRAIVVTEAQPDAGGGRGG